MQKIITRFPPSPTGLLHIGSVRTALFNFLYARQNKGQMILRFEDTDKERSKKEYEEDVLEGLKWLGINHDNKQIERQSERGEIYRKYLTDLIDDGKAYEAEESESGEGKVVRFKNPNKEIVFEDNIRGEIKFDTTELGDFVIARNIENPLYHLAVVVDDFEMNVTHIIRGEDGISNTPRQILIQEAIGAPRPTYAHLPLVLATDKSKLSKRKHGEMASLSYYRERGYLPEAIVNFVALIGWNPGDEREIFSMDELIKEFSLERVQKGGAVFNIEKLDDINSQYIKKLSVEEFIEKVLGGIPDSLKLLGAFSEERFYQIAPMLQEKVSSGEEAKEMIKAGEFDYFFTGPSYDMDKLYWKDTDKEKTAGHLEFVVNALNSLQDTDFVAETIKSAVWDYATEQGRGEVLWPMRYALSGKEKSPDPFEIAAILGKNVSIQRINTALEVLKDH
jgi:glutamyl-tRNA synthetase